MVMMMMTKALLACHMIKAVKMQHLVKLIDINNRSIIRHYLQQIRKHHNKLQTGRG